MNSYIQETIELVSKRNPNEPEFLQAVKEVLGSIAPVIERHKKYQAHAILERITEPERQIIFRVPWVDDSGKVQVNRGYSYQFSSAIGPYKGGLRFHPTVNPSVLKFLAFEQVFKNSLTTLPMGGGKGGADFNPKGKSEEEVMRFCQSFMSEFYRYLGPNTYIPAGDIGVGKREVGYFFGQYKKLANEFTGVFTGKGLQWGGSLIRPEATGYGCVYFAKEMLLTKALDFKGKTCLISGSGNVAQYTVEKLIEFGAKVLTMSDSSGFIYDKEGIDTEKLAWIMELKNTRRGRISEYVTQYPSAEYHEGKRPWAVPAQCAFPSATQNEIDEEDAKTLLKNGCTLVAEGANMPSTLEAIEVFLNAKILYAPSKAANAGGVTTSGLEMTQNSMRLTWTAEEVNARLHHIMQMIHSNVYNTSIEYGQKGNYLMGANIAGFVKVADAMIDKGVV